MLESISEEDDQIMTLYLEGEDIPEKMIRAALRKRDDRQQDRSGHLRLFLQE